MERVAVAGLVVFALAAVPSHAAAACGAARPSATEAWRGELLGRTAVSDRAGGHARRWVTPRQAGALLVLATRRERDGRCWLQVRLPVRPNTAKGWVDAGHVQPSATPWRIEVRLRSRTVTLLRRGKRVRRYRAVVGAPATPTPRGLFALVEAYPNASSDFLGSWVLTLTAHSDVLERYEGGDGRVALHGRGGVSLRDPLGSAASHGCVRVSNAAIASIVRRIGAAAIPGTPVRITQNG
jgi:L,D-transpeptidase-like protein